MKNAGRAGIVPKGDFSAQQKYKRLDAVMYSGTMYIAKKDVPLGTLPTDVTYWMKSITGGEVAVATTEHAGVVKPDGETITVDEDGTLHGNASVEVDTELSKESSNPVENKAVAKALENKLNKDGDSTNVTTTFTSADSTNVTAWTDVEKLTSGEKHSSILKKVSTMFKNIRYLYHMLGTADISTLGEGANIGTVTGAISKLNSDMTLVNGNLCVHKLDFLLGDFSEMKVQLSGDACYLFINTHAHAAPQVTIIKCFYGARIFFYQISAKTDNDYVEFVKDDSNTWFTIKSINYCRGYLYMLDGVLIS